MVFNIAFSSTSPVLGRPNYVFDLSSFSRKDVVFILSLKLKHLKSVWAALGLRLPCWPGLSPRGALISCFPAPVLEPPSPGACDNWKVPAASWRTTGAQPRVGSVYPIVGGDLRKKKSHICGYFSNIDLFWGEGEKELLKANVSEVERLYRGLVSSFCLPLRFLENYLRDVFEQRRGGHGSFLM